MVRELQFGDIGRLLTYPIEFPFPDLSSGLYCSQKALLDEREHCVGTALLKLTAEAIIILDPKLNDGKKAGLIIEAFNEMPEEMKKFGLDQIHVFVIPETDERYAEMLKKHFKFERTKGIPLVYTK